MHGVRCWSVAQCQSISHLQGYSKNGSFLTLAWWRGLRGGCVDLEVCCCKQYIDSVTVVATVRVLSAP